MDPSKTEEDWLVVYLVYPPLRKIDPFNWEHAFATIWNKIKTCSKVPTRRKGPLLHSRLKQCLKPSIMTLPTHSCRSSHAGLSWSKIHILIYLVSKLMCDAYHGHQQPWILAQVYPLVNVYRTINKSECFSWVDTLFNNFHCHFQ